MKRITCTACDGTGGTLHFKCPECHGVGFHEHNTTGCTHLPPHRIESEPMVGGWMCECGASGPWDKAYDKAYATALRAQGKKPAIKLKDRFPVPNDEASFAKYFENGARRDAALRRRTDDTNFAG